MLFRIATRARPSAPLSRHLSRSLHLTAPRLQSVSPSSTKVDEQLGKQISSVDNTVELPIPQAPNRLETWSAHQQPRDEAMVGPRFEQMNMEDQPQPWAAIDLIHKVPVRWSHDRVVSCDGGGGPLGHPRIFINLDKPKITPCTYCGTPYAHEHHRKFLASLPSTPYPLE